ncbi:hypothetical protein [Actinoplanes sp. N902-109]|uniref:hypothetical protein n=1 Tax=Actinoplanes sp. (strain N902-109) TaxID=649831 RepID=UPI0003294B03|nr:hypothetical protein [Actinoplanes sp. N902-109]AGL17837.1 hypothetical protein L083_4327 [Actinoplanes sp. N902-109]
MATFEKVATEQANPLMTKAMAGVAEASTATSTGMERSRGATAELASAAAGLQSLVSRFRF